MGGGGDIRVSSAYPDHTPDLIQSTYFILQVCEVEVQHEGIAGLELCKQDCWGGGAGHHLLTQITLLTWFLQSTHFIHRCVRWRFSVKAMEVWDCV